MHIPHNGSYFTRLLVAFKRRNRSMMFMMAFSIVQNCLICRNTAINFLYAYRISCMSIILSSHNILTLCWRHADSTNTVQCCVVDVAAGAVDNRIYQYCRRHPNHFIQAFSVALVPTDSRIFNDRKTTFLLLYHNKYLTQKLYSDEPVYQRGILT